MAFTQVILTENIPSLGAEADIVKVKAGYANNFLVPQGKASFVTPASLKTLNKLKAIRAEREARELNEAEALGRKINKLKLTIVLETGESGKAFGSITTHDIVEKLKAELSDSEIDHHKVQLERPIKTTGKHEVPVKLHAEVTALLNLNVEGSFQIENPEKAQEEA